MNMYQLIHIIIFSPYAEAYGENKLPSNSLLGLLALHHDSLWPS